MACTVHGVLVQCKAEHHDQSRGRKLDFYSHQLGLNSFSSFLKNYFMCIGVKESDSLELEKNKEE